MYIGSDTNNSVKISEVGVMTAAITRMINCMTAVFPEKA